MITTHAIIVDPLFITKPGEEIRKPYKEGQPKIGDVVFFVLDKSFAYQRMARGTVTNVYKPRPPKQIILQARRKHCRPEEIWTPDTDKTLTVKITEV
jgi:hypothetical protein